MKMFRTLFAAAAAGAVTLSAADLSKVLDPKRWSPYECTVTAAEGGGLTVNMPVDHKGGQKDYPIGWPRTYFQRLRPEEKDWSKAKSVFFKFKLEFTGTTQKFPVTFHVRTLAPGAKKAEGIAVLVPGVVNNKEVAVEIPLEKLKNPENVAFFGFSISESLYKHGEILKFTVRDMKLIEK